MSRLTVSIDPGVNGTGLAIWNEGELLQAETFYGFGSDEWEHNVVFIMQEIRKFLFTLEQMVGLVVIERPMFFPGFGGLTVASTGSLCKLSMLAGMLFWELKKHENVNTNAQVILIEPGKWKGQLSKPAAEKRIRKVLGSNFPKCKLSNHAVDAIGIGLWAQGRF